MSEAGWSAGLDEATQGQLEEAQRSGPYRLANRLGVDDVIDPREIRDAILNALVLAEGRDRTEGRLGPGAPFRPASSC